MENKDNHDFTPVDGADKTSEEYQPYSREEAEEMAQNKWPNAMTIYDRKLYDQSAKESWIEGRMSLADKCKSLQSENERMREALEKANARFIMIEDHFSIHHDYPHSLAIVLVCYEGRGEIKKALNQSPTKP
jgi:hypothetical protein